MQPRSAAVGEDDVVRITLALQERKDKIVRAVHGNVLGHPKSHRRVEIARGLQLRRQDLEMIEPVRHAGPELLE